MKFLVSYLKLKFDKARGVLPSDLRLAAICESQDAAEAVARALVNDAHPASRATILPRVTSMQGDDLLEAMYDAQELAEAALARMGEAWEVMRHTSQIRSLKR